MLSSEIFFSVMIIYPSVTSKVTSKFEFIFVNFPLVSSMLVVPTSFLLATAAACVGPFTFSSI